MDINDIPRGQLSTIILTSLLSGDKYGYEIINEVEEKTNGELIIKKPSLYSSLSRMENQDLVSSYWKDSEIGGRRHYYRLTDYGKKQVLQWQEDLINSQAKVSKIIKNEPLTEQTTIQKDKELHSKDIVAHQENLFGKISSHSDENQQPAQSKENTENVFLQYDLFSTDYISTPAVNTQNNTSKRNYVFNTATFENFAKDTEDKIVLNSNEDANLTVIEDNNILENQIRIEDKIDKSSNLESSSPKVEIGNFEIEQELNKYKKAVRSYADNVVEGKVKNYANFDFVQPDLSNNNSFFAKNLESYDEVIEPISTETSFDDNNVKQELEQENLPDLYSENQPIKDDAVLITDALNEDEFKVKKIEPASFSHLTDSPSFNQTKISKPTEKQSSTDTYYEDYESLKQYYKKMKINLKVYGEKEEIQAPKNEIKIYAFKFFTYLTFFCLILVQSLCGYFVLNHFQLITQSHLPYYLVVIGLALLPLFVYLFKYIKYPDKKIDKQSVTLNPLWFVIVLILLISAIICSLNTLFGMNWANLKYYITTSIYPMLILFDYLIVQIIKKIVIKIDKTI